MTFKTSLSKLGFDWFILGLILAVFISYLYPGAALIEEPVSLKDITNIGITFIFFFYGLKLDPEKIVSGLSNWKMHLLIQATTFIVFPLLILTIKPFFKSGDAQNIWLGLFFLAVLPSTVSASVVMVSIAKGNITAAIFNASISTLIGLLITPLWMSFFIQGTLHSFNLGEVVLKLSVQVLLPVCLGLLLHRRLGTFVERNKNRLKIFDQLIILLIVYTAFSKSFSIHVFEGISMAGIFLLAAAMLLLFFVILFFVKTICSLLRFSQADAITVMFCASKKSLVHGTLMSGVLFAGSGLTGLILLPVLLYHPLQIIVASFIANRIQANSTV